MEIRIIIFILQYKAINEKYILNILKAARKQIPKLWFHYMALGFPEYLYPTKQAHEHGRFERITPRRRQRLEGVSYETGGCVVSEAESGRCKTEEDTLVEVQRYSRSFAARPHRGSLPFIHANALLIPNEHFSCWRVLSDSCHVYCRWEGSVSRIPQLQPVETALNYSWLKRSGSLQRKEATGILLSHSAMERPRST